MSLLTQMIKQHIDYNYWAHRRAWACVVALSDDQFTQPLTYSQGSIHNQIVHTMWAEEVWLTRMLDQPQPTYTAADFPTRDSIRTYWDDLEARFRTAIEPLDDAELERPVRYYNSKGTAFEQMIIEIVLHVVNHGMDHRAQTLAMMHTLGAETIDQDVIAFLRRA